MTLVHDISSTDDTVYDALANQSVTVSITENDAVGITLSPTTLTVNEGEHGGLHSEAQRPAHRRRDGRHHRRRRRDPVRYPTSC